MNTNKVLGEISKFQNEISTTEKQIHMVNGATMWIDLSESMIIKMRNEI